eukprot:15452-Heterococcus_DN1.PRE.2
MLSCVLILLAISVWFTVTCAALCDQMTARNVQPIPFQYKCAVQLCEAEGRHEEALWAIEHAVEHGVAPDADTYSAAIRLHLCLTRVLASLAIAIAQPLMYWHMYASCKQCVRASSDAAAIVHSVAITVTAIAEGMVTLTEVVVEATAAVHKGAAVTEVSKHFSSTRHHTHRCSSSAHRRNSTHATNVFTVTFFHSIQSTRFTHTQSPQQYTVTADSSSSSDSSCCSSRVATIMSRHHTQLQHCGDTCCVAQKHNHQHTQPNDTLNLFEMLLPSEAATLPHC